MEQVSEQKSKWNLTDHLRGVFKGILDPIGAFLNRLGLYPNTMTILGLIGNTIGAIYLSLGHMTIGGILILLMGPVDALDGTMARLRGMAGEFGAFVDSVTDRYSERKESAAENPDGHPDQCCASSNHQLSDKGVSEAAALDTGRHRVVEK